jgi:DNA-binding transcriptional ArsR family regulator
VLLEAEKTTTGIADQMRHFATAIEDPTRGMILVELDRAGELTGTQIARRLDLTVNNVYHHLRVLRGLGVIDPPRIVPGDTYVEKYYSINSTLRAALRLDPDWYGEMQDSLTLEDQQAIVVSVCLTMAHLLRQAARDYQAMDPRALDAYMRDQRMFMQMISRVSREQLRYRVDGIHELLERSDREFAEDLSPRTNTMLIATLPALPQAGGQ